MTVTGFLFGELYQFIDAKHRKEVNDIFEQAKEIEGKRIYSEEEVYNILVEHTIELFKGQPCTLDEFFEKIKKK
jgi:hypothetical protein